MFETIGNTWMWVGFGLFVLLAVAIDIFALNKKQGQKVRLRKRQFGRSSGLACRFYLRVHCGCIWMVVLVVNLRTLKPLNF